MEERALLPTALCRIGRSGVITGTIRVLCDTGAQCDIITLDCVRRHDLTIIPRTGKIVGIGDKQGMMTSGIIMGELYDRFERPVHIGVQFVVVPDIEMILPDRMIDPMIVYDSTPMEVSADPEFYRPAKVDAIIGAGTFAMLMTVKRMLPGIEDSMMLGTSGYRRIATELGYVFLGVGTSGTHVGAIRTMENTVSNEELDQALSRLWTLEEPPKEVPMAPEDRWCEEQFEKTHYRDDTGRYVVQMPIIEERLRELGDTREIAQRVFFSMERRLQRNPEWREKYIAFMREYQADGHMQVAQETPSATGMRVYIPHHALSSDKKYRIVFNGSAANASGLTFNDTQCTGPRLQGDLVDLVVRFRRGKVALSADVKKMFRQVRIAPEQLDYQRILWREGPDRPLLEYQLTVVTYGLKCSPYISVKAMQQNGKDHATEYPLAARAIANDFYMDDYLGSVDSLAEAQQTRLELEASLSKGRFELAKWAASNPAILKDHERQEEKEFVETEGTSVLGLVWQPGTDVLKFKLRKYDEANVITKRVVASEGARLYDPSGMLMPFTVRTKLIMQDIWREGGDWEDEVSPEIAERWRSLRQEIPDVARMKIPRWIGITATSKVQLHVFCDASKRAMGVAMYIRTIKAGQKLAKVGLIAAKSKVAPKQMLTIPRLELEACKIGARSSLSIAKALAIPIKDIRYWTDSEVVLHWLRKAPHEAKVFVAHRVAIIQECTEIRQWSHVGSADNPADLITRGTTVRQLEAAELWWEGPRFLEKEAECWPKWPPNLDEAKLQEASNEMLKPRTSVVAVLAWAGQNGQAEGKRQDQYAMAKREEIRGAISEIFENHATMRKALRVTTYVLRFIQACRELVKSRNGDVEAGLVAAVTRKRTAATEGKQSGASKGKKPATTTKKKPKDFIYLRTKPKAPPTAEETRISELVEKIEPVSHEEYEKALVMWIRLTQQLEFEPDWQALHKRQVVTDKSSLKAFVPFLDAEGCMRVRGRLEAADLDYDQKHPFLLPAHAPLSRRLMEEAHIKTEHGGVQLSMQFLRERYWITGLRRAMKLVTWNCVRCTRYRQQASHQLMSDLPSDRVRMARPFLHCGIDYAGPYKIKARTGRNTYVESTAYVALFICCCTRLIHLELVSNATTQAFLAALDRMIARRGSVEQMRSDQGTQFVGAVRELEEAFNSWNMKEMKAEVVKRGITWKFNTPLAPHQGGLWEAGVKSMKYHLRRVVGKNILTFEEFVTVLARVEAVLNSRPLTALSDDPTDMTALTPAHFAVRGPIVRPLGPHVVTVPDNRLTHWQHLHKMDQDFASRWQADYLSSMQTRHKWRSPERNIRVGDMVFLLEDNLPPGQWLLGRIVECFPGKDGLVRNVRILTENGEYRRPAAKCCLLPLDDGNGKDKMMRHELDPAGFPTR